MGSLFGARIRAAPQNFVQDRGHAVAGFAAKLSRL
jgi:hypothetical protein